MSTTDANELKERPIGELMKQLAQETTTLVRQEIELAKAEVTQKGRRAGVGIGILGAAGVVGLLTAGALTAFLILVLDTFMPAWLAALIVTVVYAAIAGALYLRGREKVEEVGKPIPEQTVETVKEDVQWAKSQATSGER
jgi:tetrahydromethanopterin S-methyltransferase subunit C